MSKTVKIYCKNTNKYEVFPMGSTVKDVYEKMALKSCPNAISARVNNKSESLNFELFNPKKIEFLNTKTSSGMRIYVRTLTFLISSAIEEIYEKGQFRLEHPVAKGYFCNIDLGKKIELSDLESIKNRVNDMIKSDFPIEYLQEETSEVIKIFKEKKRQDVVDILETKDDIYSGYYKMGWHVDFYYGALAISAGYINIFDLVPYFDGFLLRIPDRKNPVKLEKILPQNKMMEVFHEYLQWNKIMCLSTVGDLNKKCLAGFSTDLINVSEALQEKKIADIAEKIFLEKNVKMVLISGPSSSGKTTFSKRLSIQLMVLGLKPIAISLDNYFVNRENTPVDKDGNHDFESLYALDLKLFNEHLNALIAGEEVDMPEYNFQKGIKEYNGHKLKLTENNILILEGIHALNPDLLPGFESKYLFKVYVSALTSISIDNHNWIPTTDNRLLRRIIRDYYYRAYSAKDTIMRWKSVREGEEKWIFPFQENADIMFNSALTFEFSSLRYFAEPILREVPQKCAEYAEAKRLLIFLSYFIPIPNKEIPPTSLIREFLGGSSFRY